MTQEQTVREVQKRLVHHSKRTVKDWLHFNGIKGRAAKELIKLASMTV